ncbi:anthranilate synthase component I [Methanobrevibacter sp. DSM 116169]|uniref:anthranilate synthase component I n=1 Tax=Methanobrevibacter sp. DSM 116169 TaxID=3242727 RepID=UPI0038FC8A09
MFSLSIDEVKNIASNKDYKRIPIAYEMYADISTPIDVLKKIKKISKHCYLLESVESSKKWGRYSFLGFNPILEFTCDDGIINIKKDLNNDFNSYETKSKSPRDFIKDIIKENRSPNLPDLPNFTGGLVGYFAYDYIKYTEPSIHLNAENQDEFKDIDLMLFDKVIVFDHFKQKIIIIINFKTDFLEENYEIATKELKVIANLIKNGEFADIEPLKLKTDFKPLFSKDQFTSNVKKAKNYIKDGDIFQVVLSNRFEAEITGNLLDTYRVLRTSSPSPYMFYFSSDDIEIAGASPETLVKLENRKLHTFPLAGTRPRGKTKKEDLNLEKELLSDEKELAEHNMLVDLGRNDIGKISEFGSVSVDKYLSVEKFSHVMHIGSTISGLLRQDLDELSAIDSILPAGTLSGAPKIRACEIINELENNKRGIYGGTIGYIDLSGNIDTCISIRIAFARNNKVYVRSGAGIVADSISDNEFEECLNKAESVISALKTANGGID